MKISLKFKIIGSFALIVFLALGTAVGTGNRLTRSRYDDFAYQRDRDRARSLSRALGEWTSEAAHSDTAPAFPPPGVYFLTPLPDREAGFDRPGGMMSRMMGGMMDRHMPQEYQGMDFMVITDLTGEVLLDTAGFGRSTLETREHDGIPISHDGRDAGYLYMGRMIPNTRNPADLSVLKGAGRTTWLVAALIFLFAMLLGLILTRHIIGPVKTLNKAARDIEGGNLSVRVPEERKDELGDLSRGFNAMTESLDSADKQRRRLIADSAHELRTPVSLIRARIEMMEEGIYPLDGEGLAALSAESERLTHLVDELKTLSDLESPNFKLQREDLNLQNLIHNVIQAAGPSVLRGNINVSAPGADEFHGPDVISADRQKLHRLLTNLLSNALRYAESRVLINARFSDDGSGRVEIAVEDDGPGIAEEERDKIFQRYYRADVSRNRSSGGSGLGLAICLEIARAHGGIIEAVKSAKLDGAELRVILPTPK